MKFKLFIEYFCNKKMFMIYYGICIVIKMRQKGVYFEVI